MIKVPNEDNDNLRNFSIRVVENCTTNMIKMNCASIPMFTQLCGIIFRE